MRSKTQLTLCTAKFKTAVLWPAAVDATREAMACYRWVHINMSWDLDTTAPFTSFKPKGPGFTISKIDPRASNRVPMTILLVGRNLAQAFPAV